jgi:hypothetical protein
MKITRIFYALMGISLCSKFQTSCTGETRPEDGTTEKTTLENPNTLASATEAIN